MCVYIYIYTHLYIYTYTPLFGIIFVQRCFAGPGLAIRVICAEEPYVCKDFPETNNILKIVADFSASVKKVRKFQIWGLSAGSVVT